LAITGTYSAKKKTTTTTKKPQNPALCSKTGMLEG
jgi:hypothetical protein